MSQNKEKRSRKKKVPSADIAKLNSLLRQLVDRMEQAIPEVPDEGFDVDGWDSAWRGAELVRSQFLKIIGEVELRRVRFDRRNDDAGSLGTLAAENHAEYETKTKASKKTRKQEQ